MLLYITSKMNDQNRHMLELLEIKYNKDFHNFFSYFIDLTSDNNTSISKTLKDEVKYIISINLWFINKLRHIIQNRKRKKGKLVNNQTILLDNVTELKHDHIIKIYNKSNNSYHIFDINNLIHIINNALTNHKDGYPSPYKPKNPYTNIEFTYFDVKHIYSFISKSNLGKTNVMTLYEMSNFNLEYFIDTFDRFICKITTINHINEADNTEINRIYKEFLNESNILSTFMKKINVGCNRCIKSFIYNNNRDCIKPILSKYLFEKYTDDISEESVIMFSNLFLANNGNQKCINEHIDTNGFVYLDNLIFNIGI